MTEYRNICWKGPREKTPLKYDRVFFEKRTMWKHPYLPKGASTWLDEPGVEFQTSSTFVIPLKGEQTENYIMTLSKNIQDHWDSLPFNVHKCQQFHIPLRSLRIQISLQHQPNAFIMFASGGENIFPGKTVTCISWKDSDMHIYCTAYFPQLLRIPNTYRDHDARKWTQNICSL